MSASWPIQCIFSFPFSIIPAVLQFLVSAVLSLKQPLALKVWQRWCKNKNWVPYLAGIRNIEGRKRRCPGFQQEPLLFHGKTPEFAVPRPLNCAGPSSPWFQILARVCWARVGCFGDRRDTAELQPHTGHSSCGQQELTLLFPVCFSQSSVWLGELSLKDFVTLKVRLQSGMVSSVDTEPWVQHLKWIF